MPDVGPYVPPASGLLSIQPGSQAWLDDFSTDRTATDYDLAGGGNIVVSGGSVRVSATGAEGRICVKPAKYPGIGNQVAQMKVSPLNTVVGSILNLTWLSTNNNILLILDLQTNIWTSFKSLAGVVTASAFSQDGSFVPTAGTSFWVRWMRKNGMNLVLIYLTDPLLDKDAVPVMKVWQTVIGPADTIPLSPCFSLQAAATGNLLADDLRAWA